MKRAIILAIGLLMVTGAAEADSVKIHNTYYNTTIESCPPVVIESPSICEPTPRRDTSVMGEGWAWIDCDRPLRVARAAAIRAALDDALARCEGAYVRSHSTVRDHVLIDSTITLDAHGEIARYDIIEEYKRGDRYYVRLRAWTPRRYVEQAGLDCLRLGVMIVDRDGATESNRTVMRALQRELAEWGLPVAAEAYRCETAAPLTREVREFGRRHDADHVLVVEIDERTHGRGLRDRYVQEASLTVRVVRVSDGTIESTLSAVAAGDRGKKPVARVSAFDSAATALARQLATSLADDHDCLTRSRSHRYSDSRWDDDRYDRDRWDD